ncbi:hypothetical protein H9P43_002022 [Blastocladiella emersonii ATCC 22665]|nr:hypothetical protein H9P43_002022 [Blastocladiella emersonii ATCC 22665]
MFPMLLKAMNKKDPRGAQDALTVAFALRDDTKQVMSTLSTILASCPMVTADQRPQWDECYDLLFAKVVELSRDPALSWFPNDFTLSALARLIARRQLGTRVPAFETELLSRRPPPTAPLNLGDLSKFYSGLINMFSRTGLPHRALDVYRTQIPDAAMSVHIMTTAASAMATVKDATGVREVMESAAQRGFIATPFDSGHLNVALVNASPDADSAVAAFREMLDRGTPPPAGGIPRAAGAEGLDAYAHATHNPRVVARVLERCSIERKADLAQSVVALARAHGIALEENAMYALMALQLHCEDYAAALAQYAEYVSAGEVATSRLTCMALEAAAALGKGDVVRQMHADTLAHHRAGRVVLTSQYVTAAVKSVLATDGYDAAVAVYHKLVRLGAPTHATVVHMLEYRRPPGRKPLEIAPPTVTGKLGAAPASAAPGNPAAANPSSPDAIEYEINTQVERLLAADRVGDALRVWRSTLAEHGVAPSTSTLGFFINHFSQQGDVPRMEQMLALGQSLGVVVHPRHPIRSMLVLGYSLGKRFDRVFELWDAMMDRGIAPDGATQALVLDACGFAGDRARLDATVNKILGAAWGGRGINVWTSAVEAYLRLHDVSAALRVATEIVPSRGLKADAKFIGTLVTVEIAENRQLNDPRVLEYVRQYAHLLQLAGHTTYQAVNKAILEHEFASGPTPVAVSKDAK